MKLTDVSVEVGQSSVSILANILKHSWISKWSARWNCVNRWKNSETNYMCFRVNGLHKEEWSKKFISRSFVSLVLFSLSIDFSQKILIAMHVFICYISNFLSLLFIMRGLLVIFFFFSNSSNECMCLCVLPCALVTNPTWKVHKEKRYVQCFGLVTWV